MKVKLFWTGGWDSSFRLFEIVLIHRKPVQPYYVLDPVRGSLHRELHAMKTIRQALSKLPGNPASLIAPTIYIEKENIAAQPTISDWHARLDAEGRQRVGRQYEWLARLIADQQLQGIELCITKHGRIRDLLVGQTEETENGIILKPQHHNSPLRLFEHYRFPLFNISKVEMAEIAKKQGFYDLLLLTWFCHDARFKSTPCGRCNPCKDVLKEGLTWRLPLIARICLILFPSEGRLYIHFTRLRFLTLSLLSNFYTKFRRTSQLSPKTPFP